MTIVGRLTADAAVNQTKDERNVVNFSVAVNDSYRKKGSTERTKVTSYFNCLYWISDKVAKTLKKGTLVEVNGRVEASSYITKQGEPKASLNCHVSQIKILAFAKEVEIIGHASDAPSSERKDDLPF